MISLGSAGLGTMGLGAMSVVCGQRGAAESCWRGVLIRELPSWFWSPWRHWLEDPALGSVTQLIN